MDLGQEQHEQALAEAKVTGLNTFFWCEVTSKNGPMRARYLRGVQGRPLNLVQIYPQAAEIAELSCAGLDLGQEQHEQALAEAKVTGLNTFFWCEMS